MKKIKIFLTIIIVIVYSITSFGAVAVSDGSAFITKVEFNSNLNILSNRMTAMENSIEAKIDNLVSSYLSRNGIWSGNEQNFSLNNTKFVKQTSGTFKDFYLYTDSEASGYRYFNTSFANTSYNNSLYSWIKTIVNGTPTYGATRLSGNYMPYLLLLSKITKSGLLNLTLNLSATDSVGRLGCSYKFEPSSTNSYTIYPAIKVDLVIYQAVTNNSTTTYTEVSRINISTADITRGNANVATSFTMDTTYFRGMQQLYFFVEKESKLYLRIEYSLGTTASNTIYRLSGGKVTANAGIGNLYYKYHFKANVY